MLRHWVVVNWPVTKQNLPWPVPGAVLSGRMGWAPGVGTSLAAAVKPAGCPGSQLFSSQTENFIRNLLGKKQI